MDSHNNHNQFNVRSIFSIYFSVITVIGNITTIEWAAKVYYFYALWRNVETRVIKSFRRITITTAHST